MTGELTIETVLRLRKATRAIAEELRSQMTEHLATLTPLLRPRAVLGDYVQGGSKESPRRADKAFKELQALYETVAGAKPFGLPHDLQSPLEVPAANLEITPVDYAHPITAGGASRTVMMRRPLQWILGYTGFAPSKLHEHLAARGRSAEDVQRAVLHALVMHVVAQNQPGVTRMLDLLHYQISSGTLPEFGPLPWTFIGTPISTLRPADAVLVQACELTGLDAFEEVVDLEDIERLQDPLKQKLLELARAHAPETR